MKQLTDRYYKSVNNVTFLALYMNKQNANSSILTVFIQKNNRYDYQMEISAEIWNDISMTNILNHLSSKAITT